MGLFSRAIGGWAAVAGLAAMLAAAPATADDAPGGAVTYAEHIAPIINNNCVTCHRPGQIGPMSLLSYQDVRPWAKSIRKAVVEKSMPPWHADPAFGEFVNERHLSEEQIHTIAAWVDQGAQPGNLAVAPAPQIDTRTVWQIGEPDHVFSIPEYEVADDVEDLYMHFFVPAGFAEDRDIRAMEIRAGAPEVVHHVLVFAMPPDMGEEDMFDDGARTMRSDFIAGWAPGTDAWFYPEGYAKRLKAGYNLMFQLHYHKTPGPGTGAVDQSQFAVNFADEPVSNPTTTAWIANPGLEIPPGEPNHVSTSVFTFKTDGYVLNYTPHMHLRGREATYTAYYPDGTEEVLLHVPKWDFNWQTTYLLEEPKFMPKGTVVKSVQTYDNSAANPNNPDPTQTVYFSEATTDEMHIGFMEYAYGDKRVIAQKFGLPEGFNMQEHRHRDAARDAEDDLRRRQAYEEFKRKQEQRQSLSEVQPATAGGR